MDRNKNVMYFPHSGKPQLRKGEPKNFVGTEFLAISENLFLLYDMTHLPVPNEELSKLGFSNIPGNAVLICEEGENRLDVPDDILSNLPEILRKDSEKRQSFRNQLLGMGGKELQGEGYNIIMF